MARGPVRDEQQGPLWVKVDRKRKIAARPARAVGYEQNEESGAVHRRRRGPDHQYISGTLTRDLT